MPILLIIPYSNSLLSFNQLFQSINRFLHYCLQFDDNPILRYPIISIISTLNSYNLHNINTFIMQQDQIVKVVIIGDCGVGKSNILSRYISNEFGRCQSTIGCESMVKRVQINGQILKLMIWDTAGQEKYKSISQTYYRGAAAVILVYDITNPASFESLTKWYEELIANSQPNIIKVVVGNKVDLQSNRKVKKEQGELFAKEKNIGFQEVSAADGTHIQSIFQYIFNTEYCQQMGQGATEARLSIKLKPKAEKKKAQRQDGGGNGKWC